MCTYDNSKGNTKEISQVNLAGRVKYILLPYGAVCMEITPFQVARIMTLKGRLMEGPETQDVIKPMIKFNKSREGSNV